MNMTPAATPASRNATPETVCQEMLSLLKKLKSQMADIAEAHGLTTMQLHALHTMADGDTSMGKMAQTMHCDASNVTGIIDRLVAVGMVTRQEDPRDRRVKTIQLTSAGRSVLRQVIDELPVRMGCSRLSGPELSSLHSTIAKLTAD